MRKFVERELESKTKLLKQGLITTAAITLAVGLSSCGGDNGGSFFGSGTSNPVPVANVPIPYEIWAADQSNSVAGEASRGVNGSFMWVWRSEDVNAQLAGGAAAQPVGCAGGIPGPCDVKAVFPGTLAENAVGGPTGNTLAGLPNFGRLHGMIADPQNMYMNVNMFAPGGGYVGIVDGATKEAVALFRVTSTTNGRSLHMSFWNEDGSALLLANLHGRILERIDVTRDGNGRITGADFNQSASLGVAHSMAIVDGAKAFTGNNAAGTPLVSTVSGAYNASALADLTPSGVCKANGCPSGADAGGGGRPGNVIVCPIVSDNNNAYITFGGGGLLIADTTQTPMVINGEYTQDVINGAGCGGVDLFGKMYINAGASAGGAGATQSTFTMYTIDDVFTSTPMPENTPAPTLLFRDPGNTNTIGNPTGAAANNTGQIPGTTTRRDAHGAAPTLFGTHVHNNDRVQNVVEVFNTTNNSRTTYDLTSADGKGSGTGPCAAASVTDDAGLPTNDPAPDLMGTTPDAKYLVVALRGPTPVSVTHSAQGSCPGVGIIELTEMGASGKMVAVLRTTNTIDTAPQSAPGGYAYTGAEHSDPHGANVRTRVEDQ